METVEILLQKFEELNRIGAALSLQQNLDQLLEEILVTARRITGADGGTIYLTDADHGHLRFEILQSQSLGISYGGRNGEPVTGQFSDLALFREDGTHDNSLVATCAANTGKTINIADAYTAQGFDFSGTKRFDQATGYRTQSVLAVPMNDHRGELIGVLQLLNATDSPTDSVVPFNGADQRLVESLASQASVVLTNRRLVHQLEDLFESFIRLINTAIDEKSPYTSAHCQRVPELTMMLAEAVNDVDHGPLANLKLTDHDLYELRIAALLHDCGKVTTPVHVVDKATKLETIFDRIALIDTRFEVLYAKREAALWRAVAEGRLTQAQAKAELSAFSAGIRDDRDFLRRANRAVGIMNDADVQRIYTLADRYPWADMDDKTHRFLSEDEVHNLTIRSGTLNPAEREIINNHIVLTIKMLEQLPWPRELRNVPEFAGGHHERMDGKGYPKGLKREEMSWQARMMGIADIFEALTANDRPYKKALSVSQAIRVMDSLKENGHIDPDLYDVFLSMGVYKRYAKQFLDDTQLDL